MGIKDAHSLPSVAQEDLRYKAVKAVLNGKQLKLPGRWWVDHYPEQPKLPFYLFFGLERR